MIFRTTLLEVLKIIGTFQAMPLNHTKLPFEQSYLSGFHLKHIHPNNFGSDAAPVQYLPNIVCLCGLGGL